MKKKILSVNFLLSLVVFAFVTICCGVHLGSTSLILREKILRGLQCAPFLILSLVSSRFLHTPQPAKYYSIAAIATLIAGSLPLVILLRIPILLLQLKDYEYYLVGNVTGYVVQASVMFVLSGLIAAGYFKCAKLARKEQAETAELPKTE